EAAEKIAADLAAAGFEVLLDDRDERPGVKFKDADLMGLPLRVALGGRGLAAGGVEWKLRRDARPTIVPLAELGARAAGLLGAGGLEPRACPFSPPCGDARLASCSQPSGRARWRPSRSGHSDARCRDCPTAASSSGCSPSASCSWPPRSGSGG